MYYCTALLEALNLANHAHTAFKMASSKENLLIELAKYAQIDFKIAILKGKMPTE